MRIFTAGFTSAKDKKYSAPVNLLKIAWPAIGSTPPKDLYLSDRPITIEGVNWLALVDDWGTLAGGDTDELTTEIRLINAPVDFGSGPQRFSDLLTDYPPETATGILYQWFEGEALTASDQTELLTARIVGPVSYGEAICSLHLEAESSHHGRFPVGHAVTPADYPDAPEISIGRTKPIVIGRVEDVPALRVRRAVTTRLTSVAVPEADTLDVALTAGFPATGSVVINDNTIGYSGVTATQFTGCTGIYDFHYAGDTVIEQVPDHRYLLSDPAYPIAGISNVKVAGSFADGAMYTLDLPQGEVIFSEAPRRVVSIDTRFLQIQFDSEASGNTAQNPLSATDPKTRTEFAKISQTHPKLRLLQTDDMAERGPILKVLLRVEHWAEEQIPNDVLNVRIDGTLVGALSKPAPEDVAVTTGTTDIDHTHLDDLGFPISDPQHEHKLPRLTAYTQNPISDLLPEGINLNSSNSRKFAIDFLPIPPGNIKSIEYLVDHESFGTWSTTLPAIRNYLDVGSSSHEIFLNTLAGQASVYTTRVEDNTNLTRVWIRTDATTSHSLKRISNVSRIITYEGDVDLPEEVDTEPTGVATFKIGGVSPHSSAPSLDGTTEKSSLSVVEFFDITDQTFRDWNWFRDKVVEVEYSGLSDGRTVFVVHTAFEVEYTRRRLEVTDEVTADVDGVKDDSNGTITGVPDAVIERPDHLFRWSLLNIAGLTDSVIDDTSFNETGIQLENVITGGYQLAGVVQDKVRLSVLWQQWMQESRTELFWDPSGKARLDFRPLNQASAAMGQEVKTLTESMVRLDPETGKARIRLHRTPIREVVNHIELGYQRDWVTDRYRKIHVESDTSMIDLYGKRERPEFFLFDWCRNSAMAGNLAQFYLEEWKVPQTWVEIEVFLDQLELERGDFVTVEHSLIPGSAPLNGLILPGRHIPGSGKARRMDGLTLRIRLLF